MTTSDRYATAQTALLIGFNAIFFLFPGPALFDWPPARALSTVICAAGLVLLTIALIGLRRVIQVAPAPKDGGHLVSAGIYGVLRHPIYTAMVVLVTGLVLRRPALFTIPFGVVIIVFLVVKSRYEESLLRQAYPEY